MTKIIVECCIAIKKRRERKREGNKVLGEKFENKDDVLI